MAKKTLFLGFLTALASSMVLVSCHDAATWTATGNGGINPVVNLDTQVHTSKKSPAKAAARATTVTANDLSLKISAVDGDFFRSWASLADYDPSTEYPVGQYTVEAWYGSIENEGFDRPAYAGSTTVTVTEKQTTDVNLTATLANSMVTVSYTDNFKNYMKSWSAQLHSDGGAYLYYGPEETEPIYVKPGNVALDIEVVKPNGSGATLRATTFEAKPRYHYHILVDVTHGSGDAVLNITFDENLAKEDIEIDLSDEVLNAPAPTINGTGLENGGILNYQEGANPTKASLDIIARGSLSQVMLTTHSSALIAKGWPVEVDLMNMDEATKGRLAETGLTVRGLTDGSRLGVVDFTQVPLSLISPARTSEKLAEFDLKVIDKYGKTSEVFNFSVTITELLLTLSNPSELPLAASKLDVDLAYNGADAKTDLTFEVKNERGTWDALQVLSISEPTDEVYRVSLKVPATLGALDIRTKSAIKTSNVLTVNRGAVTDFALEVNENDVWSNHATVSLTSGTSDANLLATIATLYLSENGGAYIKANVTGTTDNRLSFDGLKPATKYDVKASLTGNEAQACTPVSFTTEATPGVPNGDFETLEQKYTASDIYQGGQWSISAGVNYQNKATYTVSEATGWATTNIKTMNGKTSLSGSGANTWFYQPSVFNTSLPYKSVIPNIKFINTGGGTEYSVDFCGIAAQSGSNAMVIRNVGWDPAGSVPSVWKKEFADKSDYYNHTAPNVANVSAGKMFLGSYSCSGGNETYNEGVAFTSRPTAMTGYWKYTADEQDSSDHGVVKVELLNGNTVIATGTANLGASADYQQFKVVLNYIANAPKATALRIMVTSSKYASASQAEETANIKATNKMSRTQSYKIGATLVVDNFQFVY